MDPVILSLTAKPEFSEAALSEGMPHGAPPAIPAFWKAPALSEGMPHGALPMIPAFWKVSAPSGALASQAS